VHPAAAKQQQPLLLPLLPLLHQMMKMSRHHQALAAEGACPNSSKRRKHQGCRLLLVGVAGVVAGAAGVAAAAGVGVGWVHWWGVLDLVLLLVAAMEL
jgi:hypothetical protein